MLIDYNRIFFLDLRPWLLAKEPMVKYKILLQETELIKYNHQPVYDIEWTKPANVKQEYYQRFIENIGIGFLNDFQKELKSMKDPREKTYLIQSTIKSISSIVRDFNQVRTSTPSGGETVYVFETLKHQLVRLMLEAQEIKENIDQTIDEVYQTLFNEPAPNPEVIIDAAPISEELPLVEEEKPVYGEFRPRLEDFRSDSEGILSYDTIIKNPKRFAEVEQDLFLQGFIDSNYNFTHTHGLKNELAGIYHKLIDKDYFLPRDFDRLKDIKPRDIRKFLDHRYNVNLDKQFRQKAVVHNN